MAVTRKTDIEMPGPWLLDKDALLELDSILDDACERFETLQKKRMESLVRSEQEKEKESYLYRNLAEEDQKGELRKVRQRVKESREFSEQKREITIHFRSGKKVHPVAKFIEAVSHPDIAQETPTHFDLALIQGNVKVEIHLSRLWSDQLQINVSPSERDGCYDLFVQLQQWADRKKSPP